MQNTEPQQPRKIVDYVAPSLLPHDPNKPKPNFVELEAYARLHKGKQAEITTCRIPDFEVPYIVELNVHHAVMCKEKKISAIRLL